MVALFSSGWQSETEQPIKGAVSAERVVKIFDHVIENRLLLYALLVSGACPHILLLVFY